MASPQRISAASPSRARFSRDARQPRRVAIERDELDVGAFEHVRRLAAGRGARIEHALAVGKIEQIGDALRGAVLHREKTFGVSRKLRHVAAALEHDRVGEIGVRVGRDAAGEQALDQIVARGATAIHAQRQRRLAIVRIEDRVDRVGPVAAQRVDAASADARCA